MASNPSTAWTKHLKAPNEVKEFESMLKRSRYVLDPLRKLLKERLDELSRQETDIEEYANASWAYKQAHLNGAKLEIKKTLDLLSFLEE